MDKVKNTFAPHVKNEYLTTADLITGLKFGALKHSTLSPEAKDLVRLWEQELWKGKNPKKELTKEDFEPDASLN